MNYFEVYFAKTLCENAAQASIINKISPLERFVDWRLIFQNILFTDFIFLKIWTKQQKNEPWREESRNYFDHAPPLHSTPTPFVYQKLFVSGIV